MLDHFNDVVDFGLGEELDVILLIEGHFALHVIHAERRVRPIDEWQILHYFVDGLLARFFQAEVRLQVHKVCIVELVIIDARKAPEQVALGSVGRAFYLI